MYMKGPAASSLSLSQWAMSVAYNLICVKLQTMVFEVLTSLPLIHTSLPTLQLASVSCETHGFGISPILHNILCKAMASS